MQYNAKQMPGSSAIPPVVATRRLFAVALTTLMAAAIVACSSPRPPGRAAEPVPIKPQPSQPVVAPVPPVAQGDPGASTPSVSPPPVPIAPASPPAPEQARTSADAGPPSAQEIVKRPTEVGMASWYGRPFHGRRTASGERYDMHAYTAAHKTLPLASHVRVTNPSNGKAVIVRVNDRGPFIKGRTIDLSWAAARAVGIHGVGRVEIERLPQADLQAGRLMPGPVAAAAAMALAPHAKPVDRGVVEEKVASANASSALKASQKINASPHIISENEQMNHASVPGGYWLQLGAFRERESAERFMQDVMRQVRPMSPLLAVVGDARVFRLQAGPFADKGVAKAAADRVQTKMSVQPLIFLRR